MKFPQIAVFFILTLCAFGLTSQAQKSYTYKTESAVNSREVINLIFTQVKTGWAVSGEFVSGGRSCKVKGSYFPTTLGLKAVCVYDDKPGMPLADATVTGFKLSGKDALQITVEAGGGGNVLVAYRDGIKPKDDSTGGTPKSGGCTLAGLWKQDTPGIGKTDWNITADGIAKESGIGYAEGNATLNGQVLRIEWKTKTGYSGSYEWTLNSDCISVEGRLKFETGRTDTLKSSVKKS